MKGKREAKQSQAKPIFCPCLPFVGRGLFFSPHLFLFYIRIYLSSIEYFFSTICWDIALVTLVSVVLFLSFRGCAHSSRSSTIERPKAWILALTPALPTCPRLSHLVWKVTFQSLRKAAYVYRSLITHLTNYPQDYQRPSKRWTLH